jgi:glucokinase
MIKGKAIALDIGGTNIRGAIVDDEGHISNFHENRNYPDKDPKLILDRIFDIIRKIKDNNNENKIGIGIGIAGLIDHKAGIVHTSPNIPAFKNELLRDDVEEEFKMKTIIDNDSNLAGYGEAHFGAGKGASSVVMMTLGTGLGGGIILDGKILRGKDNTAAEIGHMTIEPNGLDCPCGNTGCLEAYVSATGITKRAIMLFESGEKTSLSDNPDFDASKITPLDLCIEASKGDEFSREILDDTGYYLGVGISSLVNLLNPEIIIIGGRIAECNYDFINVAEAEAKRRTYGDDLRMPIITRAKLGDYAGIIGAGKQVFDYVE